MHMIGFDHEIRGPNIDECSLASVRNPARRACAGRVASLSSQGLCAWEHPSRERRLQGPGQYDTPRASNAAVAAKDPSLTVLLHRSMGMRQPLGAQLGLQYETVGGRILFSLCQPRPDLNVA